MCVIRVIKFLEVFGPFQVLFSKRVVSDLSAFTFTWFILLWLWVNICFKVNVGKVLTGPELITWVII